MKKTIKIIIFISIFFTNIKEVSSFVITDIKTKPINNMSNNLLEQITPTFKDKKLIEINSTITIPENYNEEEIIITPKVFESLSEYNNQKNKYDININITIKNNSKNNYSYKDNSYILQTDDIRRYGIDENFNFFYNIKGFDNRKILTNFYYKLTSNEAIKSLYNNKKINISKLKEKLKKKHYKTLSKYYLDYYNKKYNTNVSNINNFEISILDDIFSGKDLNKKIKEKNLVRLSYNYFYNVDLTLNNKTIKDYMKEINNLDKFTIESNNLYNIKTMKLTSKKLYYYKVDLYMEFRLIKV